MASLSWSAMRPLLLILNTSKFANEIKLSIIQRVSLWQNWGAICWILFSWGLAAQVLLLFRLFTGKRFNTGWVPKAQRWKWNGRENRAREIVWPSGLWTRFTEYVESVTCPTLANTYTLLLSTRAGNGPGHLQCSGWPSSSKSPRVLSPQPSNQLLLDKIITDEWNSLAQTSEIAQYIQSDSRALKA